ncbi:MAG TPA: UDP-N-acetylmuramoyl-L-alanyl-D-glutamate--2,6-diaminopimelate ligase, partial [Actinomycetales bacterium]
MRPPAPRHPRETPLRALLAAVPDVVPAEPPPQALAREQVGGLELAISGVTHDSRAVRAGDLFAALPGEHAHGARFSTQAVERGAVAVLTDPAGQADAVGAGVPVLVAEQLPEALGRVCALVHDDPSAAVPVVAVTGTDGKTTTCWLVASALEALGRPAGLIGSLDTLLDGRVLLHDEPQDRRTTPPAPDLQATLALLRDSGAQAVVMEASSHGLAQGRMAGTRTEVAVFTNLGHEHLDFHGDRERYFAAKAALFLGPTTRHCVVNVDDEHGGRLAGRLQALGRQPVTVSRAGSPAADWRARAVRLGPDGSSFVAVGPHGEVPVRLALTGRFNVDNALAALAALVVLGAEPAAAAGALGRLPGVPGRMQWVRSDPLDGTSDDDHGVHALVDYAHTPGALEALLGTVREVVGRSGGPPPRVLLVLGTGGGRDATKRHRMGQAAGRG